jgi:hypothetical protein
MIRSSGAAFERLELDQRSVTPYSRSNSRMPPMNRHEAHLQALQQNR